MDNERVTWLRCYGIPCHVWCSEFFQFLVLPVGTYICMDDNTEKQNLFDVAKIMVSNKYNLVLNETFNIGVNGEAHSIKIVEDSYGPLRINVASLKKSGVLSSYSDSKSSSSGYGGGGGGDVQYVPETEASPRGLNPSQEGGVEQALRTASVCVGSKGEVVTRRVKEKYANVDGGGSIPKA